MQHVFPLKNQLLPLLTLKHSIRLGYLHGSSIITADLFRSGGPNSVRGYAAGSLGLLDGKDVLGGRALAESGLSLSFPLLHVTRKSDNSVFGHAFWNSGIIIGEPFSQASSIVVSSIGAGLAVRLPGNGRLEINAVSCLDNNAFCWTKRFGKPVLQVGLGMEFL